MSTRKKIRGAISKKINQIKKLQAEISELKKQDVLISDKKQWFEEKEETHIVSMRPKKEVTILIGRIYWKEAFLDEDTGKEIWITRNQVVRKNGEWCVSF